MSSTKVFLDQELWGAEVESVARQAEAQFPNARFAVGPDRLNESNEAKHISASVVNLYGKERKPADKP